MTSESPVIDNQLAQLRRHSPGVKPLEPSGFALFGALPAKQRSDSAPLILAVLHDGSFEDFIFGVPPHTAFDHYTTHDDGSCLFEESR